MKKINTYIIEKLKINKNSLQNLYMIIYDWNKDFSGYVIYDSAEEAANGIRNEDGIKKCKLNNDGWYAAYLIKNEEEAKKVINICSGEYNKSLYKTGIDALEANNIIYVTDEISKILKQKYIEDKKK